MADRNRYDDPDRQRRWRERDQSPEDYDPGYDTNLNREWDRTRQWRRDYDPNRERDNSPNRERDYNQNRGHDYDPNREQNVGQSRARIYNSDRGRDYGQNRERNDDRGAWRRQNEDFRGERYGENYGADWGWDENDWNSGDRGSWQGNQRDRYNPQGQIYDRDWYDWNYDEGYNSGGNRENDYNQDYGRRRDYSYRHQNRGYNREHSSGQGYNQDVNRGRDYDRNQDFDRYSDYSRDRDYDRDRGSRQPYPAAGMQSDYGQGANYEQNDMYDQNLDYRRGDVGYDSEGAFYQDMDEPINFERWEVWTIPGQFTGMGPQSYQRSDSRIEEDVNDRLTRHGRIDASDIEINVHDGEVTLKGSVPDRDMKRLAEDVAEDVTGVKEVHNDIKVKKQEPNWNRSRDRGYEREARYSPAGQSNRGAGLTDAGATSLAGMERADEVNENRGNVREGMEVIGIRGKVVGRVKEIRESDFLVDREMARDIYVPYSAIQTVGEQVMLNIPADDVDKQDWEKPNLMG